VVSTAFGIVISKSNPYELIGGTSSIDESTISIDDYLRLSLLGIEFTKLFPFPEVIGTAKSYNLLEMMTFCT
jgi:hypothetical protein